MSFNQHQHGNKPICLNCSYDLYTLEYYETQSQDFGYVLDQGKRLHDKELHQLKDVVTIH